jgi:hypothetical protein
MPWSYRESFVVRPGDSPQGARGNPVVSLYVHLFVAIFFLDSSPRNIRQYAPTCLLPLGGTVDRKNRKPQANLKVPGQTLPASGRFFRYLATFVLGAVVATGAGLLILNQIGRLNASPTAATSADNTAGRRTVTQLVALSDADLEKVDILEMNIAVAREIPGLENLEYDHYRRIVDGWTEPFVRWLPEAERGGFYTAPEKYKNDVNFFRLGMLAQFLDQTVGVAYVEDQKQMQLDARKEGRKAEIAYTDPGHLLLHGLIDSKRGTCGTMPALHVAIGRRLGWPVSLACTNAHFVCRYDDGKTVYNIEATDTGRGGFAEGSDEEYIKLESISPKAIAVGSDLRKLTAREMLGLFIAARARYYSDTGKADLAARDYCLAFTQFPNNRKAYINQVGCLITTGEILFEGNEQGHPMSLAAYLVGKYQPRVGGMRTSGPVYQADPLAEIEAINAINRANKAKMAQPQIPMGPGYPQPPR